MNKIEIDLGNTCGITRKVNSEHRISIPIDFYEKLNIKEKDKMELFLVKEGIYIRKEVEGNDNN